ncbi:MAG: hypothetical protein ABI878_05125 [Acidobacteriota bacterium]
MLFKSIFFIALTAIAMLLTACGGPTANTGNGNSTTANSANSNTSGTNANSPLGTNKKPDGEKINDAPRLKPVVEAYYDAIQKKDDAAIRKVLAAPFLKTLEADMKDEKKTNLAAYIAETDRVPEGGIQVRNENIDGDKGTAELKGGAYLNWTALGFIKENGVWKFSNMNPDVQAVDQSKGK